MEQFLLVLGIIWLAVLSPGADFAMVSRLSFMEGRRAGMLAALGIALACWIHIAYAIFGLAVVERLFPHTLDVLRIAGAAYLIYLGSTMVLARPRPAAETAGVPPRGGVKAVTTGVLTNALNPKTSIFVVSLYAQVIGGGTLIGIRLGWGVVISASHLVWFMAVAVFLSRPLIRQRVLARQRMVNTVIGAVLVTLGVLLALSDVAHVARA